MPSIYLKEPISVRRGEVQRLISRMSGYYWALIHIQADWMREENPTKKMLLELAHDTLQKDTNRLAEILRDLLISLGNQPLQVKHGNNNEPEEESVRILRKYFYDAQEASGGTP